MCIEEKMRSFRIARGNDNLNTLGMHMSGFDGAHVSTRVHVGCRGRRDFLTSPR